MNIASGQLLADFSANTISGCAPLLVKFTDNSAGNPTSWRWDLGNGSFSSQKTPVTTYLAPGFYTVKLTVSNGTLNNTITKNQYISVYDMPVVNFKVSDSLNCVPFTTTFTDLSSTAIGNISSWEWDFDDGTTSTQQNPTHEYKQPGNYNITLKATNSGGCFNSTSKLSYIKANDSIVALFNFSKPVRCKPPESIRFVNATTGPGTLNYTWDFGDGGTSAGISPTYIYRAGGVYSVKLIARNNFGCADTLIYKDTLKIRDVPAVILGPDTVCMQKPVTYSNGTVPAGLSSIWNFSDGSAAFGTSITKLWTTPGVFSLKLKSNSNICSDSVTKQIVVNANPEFNFTVNDSVACKAPLTVNYADLSSVGTSWQWYFGDGDSSSAQNPSHTYTTEGSFSVNLVVTNSAGCVGNISKSSLINILKPVASFIDPEDGGCIPYTYKPVSSAYSPDGIASYFWDFGGGNTSTNMSPQQVYPNAGTYPVKLVVTSNEGCSDSTVVMDAVKTGTPPTVDFSASPRIDCPVTSVFFTDLSFPADKWLWEFGEGATSTLQNPVHQFFDTIQRSVKLTVWNNGCSDSLRINKYINTLPGLARFRAIYNCSNKKEVTFKDSSISPGSWLWDFGDGTTSSLQNPPPHQFSNYQTYTVSLTTGKDTCSNTRRITVNIINEIPDFTVSSRSACIAQVLSFSTVNFNKDNVSKYSWDFGDGSTSTSGDSIDHSYNNTGFYTVTLTITDNHGCIETVSKTNFIQVFKPNAGFRITNNGGCLNKTVNLIDTSSAAAGNNNIAQWLWDFGDGTTQTFTAPPPAPVPHIYGITGSFYPSLIIIDSVGCSDTAFYTLPISINQPIANFFAPFYNTCTADTITFRNSSTGSRLTYLWSFGDGNFSTAVLPVKNYPTNGNYTVKLLVTDDIGCMDSMTKPTYIIVKDVSASFTVNDSTGTCIPFQVNFTNTSLNSFSQVWEFGDGGISSTFNTSHYYFSPGIFYAKLTAKRSPRCVSTDSVKIKITAPSGTLTYFPLEGCSPLNVTFQATSTNKVNFTWDFNDGVSVSSPDSNIMHAYTTPGKFVPNILLLDSSGCAISVVGMDTIKIYSSIVNFGAADTAVCYGDTVQFIDSTISGSAITGYRWEFGDDSSSIEINPRHIYSNTGSYTVKLFISTIYGCVDSVVKTSYVKVVTRPQVSITGNNPSYCGPSLISFQGNLINNDPSAINWDWSFGNGNLSGLQAPPSQQYNDTGVYTAQLIAINSSGCADTATTNIRILEVPNTFAGNDTAICIGTAGQLQATGADSYTWQPAAFLSCINCSNPVTTIQNDGSYYVTGTNTNGCQKTDSLFIDVKKPFRLSGLKAFDSVCPRQSIQLNVSGAENYSWSPATGLNNVTINNPLANPNISTTYKVIGFDSSNCFADSATIFIKVNTAPIVNAGPDLIINSGRSVTITPQYSNDVTSWLWQPPTGLNCTNCPNPVAQPADNTTYSIRVTNGSGCTTLDEIFVQVKCDKTNIFLPTAFTPNNDGRNEIFYPLNPAGTGIFKIVSLTVYNRYGELVFQNGNFYSNDKNKGWDGKHNGIDAPAGAYVYTIEFICANNKPVVFNGNILLLR